MCYKQLTEGQRYQISAWLALNFSQSKIASLLGVHRSTICRELKRNTFERLPYRPRTAQFLYRERQKKAKKRCLDPATIIIVEQCLRADWSPEQIHHVCKRLSISVSIEWIYQHVFWDRNFGGNLFKHLRQNRKHCRRGRPWIRQNPRALRPCISERPEIVDTRARLGDWEADTVLGQRGTGALVSLAERKSRLYLVQYVPNQRAQTVSQAIIEMLRPYKSHVHTITFDNGKEFSQYETIANALDASMYFAKPYASWQRGLNENSNGLLRQYIRKGTDLRTITSSEIEGYQKRLNLRPRKCLGYRQPQVIFNQLAQNAT